MRKKKIALIIWSALFVLSAACLTASWLSESFSVFYRDRIFLAFQPIWSGISGALPFSLGEIMLYVLIFGGIGMLASYAVLMLSRKDSRKKISRIYGRIAVWILLYAFVSETFNCFIMYHCGSFASTYGISEEKYTSDELYDTAVMMIERCNEAAEKLERNDDGSLLVSSDSDISTEAAEALNGIADKYVTLGGYYPPIKKIASHTLMTKMNLLGIYFPFSMEANYNPQMYCSELPSTACHELAHLKGWIQEDEANFIAFLACINSDDDFFIYSGYLSAVNYLWSAVYKNCGLDDKEYAEFVGLMSDNVRRDLARSSEVFIKAQQDKVSSSIAKISDAATETSLKLNGVSDGIKSYGRFVDLMLNYYRNND